MSLYGPTEPKSAELWARILDRHAGEKKSETSKDREELKQQQDGVQEGSFVNIVRE